jgi:hypothetical protein
MDRCRSQHRSGRHGRLGRPPIADHRLARGRGHRGGRGHGLRAPGGHQGECHPARSPDQAEREDVRRRGAQAGARGDQADRERRGRGVGASRPPEITPLESYPLNVNEKTASDRIAEAFRAHLRPIASIIPARPRRARILDASARRGMRPRSSGSSAAPILRFMPRPKADGQLNELSVNYSPKFAPVLSRRWKPE